MTEIRSDLEDYDWAGAGNRFGRALSGIQRRFSKTGGLGVVVCSLVFKSFPQSHQ